MESITEATFRFPCRFQHRRGDAFRTPKTIEAKEDAGRAVTNNDGGCRQLVRSCNPRFVSHLNFDALLSNRARDDFQFTFKLLNGNPASVLWRIGENSKVAMRNVEGGGPSGL